MKPDSEEWLHAEQARLAREGPGWVAVRRAFARYGQLQIGIVAVSIMSFYALSILPKRAPGSRGLALEPLPILILGLGEATIAGIIWWVARPASTLTKAAVRTALIAGCLLAVLGAIGLF